MSLFKRREFWIQHPDGTKTHPFQAATLEAAQVKAQAVAAEVGLVDWSLFRDPSATWSCKIQWMGKQHLMETGCALKTDAETFERRAKQALARGRSADLAEVLLRKPKITTVGEIAKLYPTSAQLRGLQEGTARSNLLALQLLIRRSQGMATSADVMDVRLTDLTPALVLRYKEAVLEACDPEDLDGIASAQRTANSVLASAKSVFTPAAREFYTLAHNLELPPTLDAFCAAPPFENCGHIEYRIPDDRLIEATIADLEARIRRTDPAVYVAAWLALGFGLRRSEIACVKAGWIVQVAGATQLELRATLVRGSVQEKEVTKNGQVFPRIAPTNGVLDRLAERLRGLQPEDYVVPATDRTERSIMVFRRLTTWLRGLGWETSKAAHELRAWAGCRVAMHDGIEAASLWLRHSSISVTQKHYGRYLRTTVTDTPLIAASSPATAGTPG